MNAAGFRTQSRVSHLNPSQHSQSNGEKEKNIWSSLLDSVAAGKKLPEKNMLLLGRSRLPYPNRDLAESK